MALIGKIRKSMWIVVVLVALGVGGFILQAMVNGKGSLLGGPKTTLGKVEGEKIEWNDFARTDNIIESVLFQNSNRDVYGRRDLLWNYYVEDIIVKKEAEKLGLGVSRTELLDLEFGTNLSPVIRQRFQDPSTGQVNRDRLNQFKTAIDNNQLTDPMIRAYWAHQENEVIKDRLQSKIEGMITKAIYTPTWMAEMGYKEQNDKVSFAYVRAPFDEIDNADVKLEEKDYEAYLKENAERYRQTEETRRLKYVTLKVLPTAADSAKIRKQIEDLIPDFQKTEEDSAFVERYYGTFDPTYFTKEELSPVIADTIAQLSVGSVFGPYIDAGDYKAVKVVDRKIVPDSVRARHILIPAQDATTLVTAQNKADSLKGLIESGKFTFDSLARAYGSDATRLKGGDLGFAYRGQMVKPFNDLIFYKAEPGKLYTVVTQYGAHLVEVTDRKYIKNEQGTQLAYLTQAIVPSEETQNALYDRALEIASNNRTLSKLEESAKKNPDLSVETSSLLKRNDYTIGDLGAGQTSRDMIRWAFDAKKGTVSPDVYIYQNQAELYNSMYVITGLENIVKAGLPSVASVKSDIEQQVINKKKGEILSERMKDKDLPALATEFSATVDTAQNITFATPTVPNVGSEPKILGEAMIISQNQTSAPIIGSFGVYKINVYDKTLASDAIGQADLVAAQRNMGAALRAQLPSLFMESLKKNVKIKDYRFSFY